MKYAAIFSVLLSSCHAGKKPDAAISDIQTVAETVDFARAFYDTTRTLTAVKARFPFFFDAATPDSVWQKKRYNALERSIYRATEALNFHRYKPELLDLFKHLKFYYPDCKLPTTYWYVSGLDWQNPVFYRDSLLLVAGDLFLGADSKFYQRLPRYMRARFDPAQKSCPKDQTFLAQLLYFGKIRMLAKALVPQIPDYQLMGYTTASWQWCLNNEFQIWNYFITADLLYQKDKRLKTRFLSTAPFSKFYLEIDTDSPDRVGIWIGWRIMQAYRDENSQCTLPDIIRENDPMCILKASQYKPKP